MAEKDLVGRARRGEKGCIAIHTLEPTRLGACHAVFGFTRERTEGTRTAHGRVALLAEFTHGLDICRGWRIGGGPGSHRGAAVSVLVNRVMLICPAREAYDYLTRTGMIRSEPIVLFGRSLGVSVAGELAARKPAAALIIESPFPSVEAVARFHCGGLAGYWLLERSFG